MSIIGLGGMRTAHKGADKSRIPIDHELTIDIAKAGNQEKERHFLDGTVEGPVE
jgi:Tfp pilus assembly protein PilX